jgi:hypothetical protein
MMFIEALDCELINTDYVVRIERSRRKNVARWEMAEGPSAEVAGSTADELVSAQSLIPAQPGFTLLAFYSWDDGKEIIERSPIAWRVDVEMPIPCGFPRCHHQLQLGSSYG